MFIIYHRHECVSDVASLARKCYKHEHDLKANKLLNTVNTCVNKWMFLSAVAAFLLLFPLKHKLIQSKLQNIWFTVRKLLLYCKAPLFIIIYTKWASFRALLLVIGPSDRFHFVPVDFRLSICQGFFHFLFCLFLDGHSAAHSWKRLTKCWAIMASPFINI